MQLILQINVALPPKLARFRKHRMRTSAHRLNRASQSLCKAAPQLSPLSAFWPDSVTAVHGSLVPIPLTFRLRPAIYRRLTTQRLPRPGNALADERLQPVTSFGDVTDARCRPVNALVIYEIRLVNGRGFGRRRRGWKAERDTFRPQ